MKFQDLFSLKNRKKNCCLLHLWLALFIFQRKQVLIFHVNRLPRLRTPSVFSQSFQDSFFVSQKTSSICTKEWGGSWALGTIYCLECIKELLHILSVCKGLDFISHFAQPGVLHVSEPSLYCLAYVWIGSLTRYWAGISEVSLVFLVFLFKESLDFFNQPWCLRDTGPRKSIAEEWTVSLMTVQLSSTSSELCSSASKWLQRSLTNACLLLSCFSLETSNFFGTFLPCGHHTGWMCRLSLLTTSLWSVQQSAPHIVFVTLTSCLSLLCTMTWHPVCPSFALWHSQWDASVWSEGTSMMSFCELVDGRLCWWSVIMLCTLP